MIKLNTPRFSPPEGGKALLLSFYLCLETNGQKQLAEILRDGGGLRWTVRSKGLGLYIAKRGCVIKHVIFI